MLRLVREIMNEFDLENIKYCHWKSNEHLIQGLNGDTDLDILVDKTRVDKVKEILYRHNVKRYDSTFYLDYNSIEDFIGFDSDTGKMIHIHLHYQLKIGRKFIKEIHLPIEQYIYDNNLIKDKKTGFSIIEPNMEMILLLIRYIIKNRNKKISLINGSLFTNEYLKEFQWLKTQVNIQDIIYHCTNIFDKEFASIIVDFINKPSSKEHYYLLKSKTLSVLKPFANTNKVSQDIKYIKYKLYAILGYIKVKKLNTPIPFKRVSSHGGLTIVFVGVDGAGKSTLIKEVKRWLSWKIDIHQVYFGSGDGKSSIIRLPLSLIVKAFKKPKTRTNKTNSNNSNNQNEIINSKKIRDSALFKTFKVLWAISLAMEKRMKFKKLWKARSNGLIVISDRYPQIDIMSYNDGPLLSRWLDSKSKIKKKISKWEFQVYELSKVYKPDIVFKLKISPELSHERKPETPLKMIEKKIDAVNSMKFDRQTTKVVEVDTSKNINASLLEIKKVISELL